jgi:hypothetical protein
MQQPPIDYRERLAAQQWDCIIADIPWHYDKQGGAKLRYLAPYVTLTDYHELMQVCSAALKPDRNLWIWTDWYNLPALLLAASEAGLTYQALCCMKRVDLGLGSVVRKQMYYLPCWSNGKPYRNADAWLSEYLGEFKVKRSAKPQAVYDKLLAHSLPPGGCWIDPFPATHIEEYPGPAGAVLLAPSLWTGDKEVS